MLASTDAERKFAEESYKKDLDVVSDAGNFQFLDTNAKVRSVLPQASLEVIAATYAPESGQVSGIAAANALASLAAASGAILHENTNVKSVTRELCGDGEGGNESFVYRVVTNEGREFLADHVVLANGAAMGALLPSDVQLQALAIQPIKGHMCVSDEVLDTIHNPASFPVVYFFEGSLSWSTRQTVPANITHDFEGNRLTRHAYGRFGPDRRFYFGGDRMFTKSADDYTVDDRIVEDLLLQKVFPSIPSLEKSFRGSQVGSWAGNMPFSRDSKPIVDCLGNNLWVANGFSSSGIMDGPGAMFFLAQWIKRAAVQSAGAGSQASKPKWLVPFRSDRPSLQEQTR
jgi:glycine/D-amino acid oxidase-like deaminating enzyme